jgi:fructokinase
VTAIGVGGAGERLFGGVELGGTKVICGVGSGPDRILDVQRAATTNPEQTLGWAVAQLRAYERVHGPLEAIGIASFGPIDLRTRADAVGRILNTPKPGWAGVDVVAPFRQAFDVAIGVASDVEGAALAESIAGAARDVDTFTYLTVGTGIGAGVMVNRALMRGLLHAEMGHVAVPRQPGDAYEGGCPFHGDCLEGLASGPAIAARWGQPADKLSDARREEAMELEAAYLVAGLRAVVYAFSPERIVIGGGVGLAPGLVPRLRDRLASELAGYPGLPEHARADFVVVAGLGDRAGPAGALVLAQRASSLPEELPGRLLRSDTAPSS